MINQTTTNLARTAIKQDIFNHVTHFIVKNASGEFYRKPPAKTDDIGDYNKKFTLYLTETEANTVITGLALVIDGSDASGSGTEIASVSWNYDKTIGLQSAYYFWTLEVQ